MTKKNGITLPNYVLKKDLKKKGGGGGGIGQFASFYTPTVFRPYRLGYF